MNIKASQQLYKLNILIINQNIVHLFLIEPPISKNSRYI